MFNTLIFSLMMENTTFQIITFGDWVLNYQLPIEAA
jgi:hypothetical protein